MMYLPFTHVLVYVALGVLFFSQGTDTLRPCQSNMFNGHLMGQSRVGR